jgi:RNA polymerase subunit RPABC4/transcription elongation factor Spt4
VIASTFGGVHDFFHSSLWYVIRNLAILLVIVFWVATIYWVHKDAKRRIADPLLVWLSTAVGVLPFLGPLVYMLFRPPEYLEDVRERELEIRAMEERLGGATETRCPVCRAHVEDEFLICPVCTTRLRQACVTCGKPLEQAWQVCPYCETPIAADTEAIPLEPAPKPARRASRPRAPRASS